MKDARQIKTKKWKELTWDELADLGSLIQKYDGVMEHD
jgi:hypothetical protein